MNFYKIVFTDGSEVHEFGDSEADLREFVARCYCTSTIRQIVQLYVAAPVSGALLNSSGGSEMENLSEIELLTLYRHFTTWRDFRCGGRALMGVAEFHQQCGLNPHPSMVR